MAAYIVPLLLGVAVLLGGAVAFIFSKALRFAPRPPAAKEFPADESGAALKVDMCMPTARAEDLMSYDLLPS